jgi:hypothetical protein
LIFDLPTRPPGTLAAAAAPTLPIALAKPRHTTLVGSLASIHATFQAEPAGE